MAVGRHRVKGSRKYESIVAHTPSKADRAARHRARVQSSQRAALRRRVTSPSISTRVGLAMHGLPKKTKPVSGRNGVKSFKGSGHFGKVKTVRGGTSKGGRVKL